MEVCPYNYFRWCGYFWVPGYHLLWQMNSNKGHKNYFKGWCLMNSQPTFLFFNLFLTQWSMVTLSKVYKPDNFEPHNSLKLSFTNIWGPCSNIVECRSFLESNSPDILALCETILDESIDSGNFSVRGYLPLMRKDSINHAWSCSLCERRTSFHMGFISRKLCGFLLMYSTGFTSINVLFLFRISITFFVIMHSFWFYFV